MMPDVYLKKVVDLRYAQQVLHFRVAQELFSSCDVDTGTQRLLRTLAEADTAAFQKILDLGCGYGPLGLTLKKLAPERTVHLVDRDALAVDFARQNAALNGLAGVEVYASLGYDDLSAAGFDLILCNVPAKAGPPVISHLLRDAAYSLRPGGLVAIVVVTPLEEMVASLLSDPAIRVQLRKAWPGHTVFHYRFAQEAGPAPPSALERGVYDRQETNASFRGLTFPLRTAYGLPEFDTPSYESDLLVGGLQDLAGTAVHCAVVLNPRQGHVPVALWQLMQPAQIHLVDRDLLGLRYSRKNLVLNGCPEGRVTLSHQVGLRGAGLPPVDLIAGILREEEGPAALAATIEQAAAQVVPGGSIVLAGSSTAVTRLVSVVGSKKLLAIKKRGRSRGKSWLLLRRR
jgi:16S rRNA (guanine1207-N2)-methyltransferase